MMHHLSRGSRLLWPHALVLLGLVAWWGDGAGAGVSAPGHVERFADYLLEEGDYARAWLEYERAAFFGPPRDTLAYKAGLALRLSGEGERAAVWLKDSHLGRGCTELDRSALYQVCYGWLQSGRADSAALAAEQSCGGVAGSRGDDAAYLRGVSRLIAGDWSGAHEDLGRVRLHGADSQIRLASARLDSMAQIGAQGPRRSVPLACVLSAAVPGLGRVYAGRPGDAVFSFTAVASMGLLAYRSFERDGRGSPGGWAYATLSGLLYLGEVYGAGQSAAAANRSAAVQHRAQALQIFVSYHPPGVGLRGEFSLPSLTK